MRITVPDQPAGRLTDAWRFCVGTGRFELALRRDYQDSLALVQREIGFRHIRGHGLLSDGVGVHRPVRVRTARVTCRHAFTYVDQVVDAYLRPGHRGRSWSWASCRPASPPATRRCSGGRATSRHPRSLSRVGRPGPRHGGAPGRPVRPRRGARLADRGVERAQPQATSGRTPTRTPTTACTRRPRTPSRTSTRRSRSAGRRSPRAPTTGWRRSPSSSPPGRCRSTSSAGTPTPPGPRSTCRSAPTRPSRRRRTCWSQFAAPRQHLAGTALADLPVHITEFNSSYRPDNPIHDTAFHAAYLAPVLAAGGDLVDSFSYWTFSDVFEEVGVPTVAVPRRVRPAHPPPDQEAHLPPVRVHGPHGRPVLARGDDHLVTRDGDGRVTVLAWAPVDVTGRGTGGSTGTRWRSDRARPARSHVGVRGRSSVSEEAGNAWAAWSEMGRPRPRPGRGSSTPLREAAEPARDARALAGRRGRPGRARPRLGRHEVTLVELLPITPDEHPGLDDGRLLGVVRMTAMATRPDDETGTGVLPRWSAVVYWFLVVEAMLVLTSAPGLVLVAAARPRRQQRPVVRPGTRAARAVGRGRAVRLAGVRPRP